MSSNYRDGKLANVLLGQTRGIGSAVMPFLVGEGLGCALIFCKAESVSQTRRDTAAEARLAHKGIDCLHVGPPLVCSNFGQECGRAVLPGEGIREVNDEAVNPNAPLLPVCSCFKAVQQRHCALQALQLLPLDGRKALVPQSTAEHDELCQGAGVQQRQMQETHIEVSSSHLKRTAQALGTLHLSSPDQGVLLKSSFEALGFQGANAAAQSVFVPRRFTPGYKKGAAAPRTSQAGLRLSCGALKEQFEQTAPQSMHSCSSPVPVYKGHGAGSFCALQVGNKHIETEVGMTWLGL